MKLSIIIPCFNEVQTIEEIVNRIKNTCKYNHEIIIVTINTAINIIITIAF